MTKKKEDWKLKSPEVAVSNSDLKLYEFFFYFAVSKSDITPSLGLDVRMLILGIKFSRSLFLE